RRELGVAVEPVARLRLPRRGAGPLEPGRVLAYQPVEVCLRSGARRPYRREDAPARGMQFLVRSAGRAERELVHPIAGEAGVGVAVDKTGDSAAPAAVDLHHLLELRRKVAHRSDALGAAVPREEVCVLDHVDIAERPAAE